MSVNSEDSSDQETIGEFLEGKTVSAAREDSTEVEICFEDGSVMIVHSNPPGVSTYLHDSNGEQR